jgi:hypothetical protein
VVALENCTFDNVTWSFSGPAANTVNFLRALYHGAGEGGKKLVEDTLQNIRKGP